MTLYIVSSQSSAPSGLPLWCSAGFPRQWYIIPAVWDGDDLVRLLRHLDLAERQTLAQRAGRDKEPLITL
jgi:hypothetical protein